MARWQTAYRDWRSVAEGHLGNPWINCFHGHGHAHTIKARLEQGFGSELDSQASFQAEKQACEPRGRYMYLHAVEDTIFVRVELMEEALHLLWELYTRAGSHER
jgi:hypothetical protein